MIKVEEVIDLCYGPDYRYFKLRGDKGGIYILRQDETDETDETDGRWELTMFDAGGRQP